MNDSPDITKVDYKKVMELEFFRNFAQLQITSSLGRKYKKSKFCTCTQFCFKIVCFLQLVRIELILCKY